MKENLTKKIMLLKRILFLIVYAFVLSISYYEITNTQLPWYVTIPLGILGAVLGRVLFPNKKKDEQEDQSL
jgi:uncharacterized membrane protein YeaQ/YmgE (transglycosylase-associated protein family)